MKFKTVKGTRDFYAEQMAIRNWIVDKWRRVSLRNGFEEYDGPIFEYLDLYRAKSGEGIVSELFHFTDRGNRQLAIRPEMTPTIARMINARANSLPRPIKWFSVPRICRAERPQRGRLREFFQWNIDIVGVDNELSDAECVFVALDLFRELGLTPDDMVMKINSRSLLSALLEAWEFEPQRHEDIYTVLDKRDKLPGEVFEAEVDKISRNDHEKETLLTLGQARGPNGFTSIEELASGNKKAKQELDRLRNVLELLQQMQVGDYCEFDMGVVRGLAYYTGVVFEGFGKKGLKRAICGGGRYDQLLEILGGPPMSGIGFGTSDVVIMDLLEEIGRVPAEAKNSTQCDFFVIDADQELFNEVITLTAKLRSKGFAASFSYRRQNVGKQLKQAANRQAGCAVIIGSEYTEKNVIGVKNLQSGQQIEVSLEKFLENPLVSAN